MPPTIAICSPVALGSAHTQTLAPALPTLRGRVLGLRLDPTWRSWTVVADELARLAPTAFGVAAVTPFEPGVRLGSPEDEAAKAAAFARRIDAAVVGLGT